MNFIAYYLPQFHEIQENNKWWGKGFTEWSNMKKAIPLFKNHQQPRRPLDGYYDLMNKETMVKQANYAKEYGVNGMAFYHYWFEGKKLLEKPAENLLKWKDIEMNYMFFWANHDWIKSWKGSKEILLKQTYGDSDDWDKHFYYLLPFFKDERYIKIDGKPAIGIYMIELIPNVDQMLDRWNKLAVDNGLAGLYIIENALNKKYNSVCQNSNAVVIRQPNYSMFRFSRIYNLSKRFKKLQPFIPGCFPLKIRYSRVLKKIISDSEKFESEKDIMYGFFTGWDNTPRHGKRGSVIVDQNVKDFSKYLEQLVKLAKEKRVDYIFINAWNEWCEGMYLEPDNLFNDSFLKAIHKASRI